MNRDRRDSELSVAAVVIGFNSLSYLRDCFDALHRQTKPFDEVVFVDNASHDGSTEFVARTYPGVVVLASMHNGGFGFGANAGIGLTKSACVLILNPDVVLDPGFVAAAVEPIVSSTRIAAVCGKTLQWDPKERAGTGIVDSTGLMCTRTRRVLDRGCGSKDEGQFEEGGEVFGVTGHCMMLRREALDDAAIEGEVFDEQFFMYKEDVDLCWRLRLLGWSCAYVPRAVAYHVRGTGIVDRTTRRGAVTGRNGLSPMQQYYAFRNHRLMLLKNARPRGPLQDGIWLLVGEVRALLWLLFMEPYNLGALAAVAKTVPSGLRKRRILMRRRDRHAGSVESWFHHT